MRFSNKRYARLLQSQVCADPAQSPAASQCAGLFAGALSKPSNYRAGINKMAPA